jgi:hypothetical protein
MKNLDKEAVEWLAEMDVLQPNLETRTMKCDHKNCTRNATTTNNQYFEGKWYCTFHANNATKDGRILRKLKVKTKQQEQ